MTDLNALLTLYTTWSKALEAAEKDGPEQSAIRAEIADYEAAKAARQIADLLAAEILEPASV
ncbi:hypothetical protein ACWT_5858 [Actinoplanes sp. SE50]|uniref:hypothetical protein n=1 Tax=unclassified Actinoplanes TaxID=2626549 RepID=UPI00023EBDCE|nr:MULTISPECIES: hypothetical protein [unclassified Actinoplanes]AEV86876.1 hypothetical protein ACPL_5989 [Actinoplanes sp. SE50/110]ATO85273.1 hypothetical protein ACWT_5858 [Actinoplanes sp. SE50]SLM02683.1 hypothetical protein ACSP50_5965 [Actinoplanes sp. SE50/110]